MLLHDGNLWYTENVGRRAYRRRTEMAVLTEAEMDQVMWEARSAAEHAASACIPRPILVGTPKDPLASMMGKDDGGFDEKEPVYYVAGGVCGFAWVKIKPARGKFVTWLKSKKIGRRDEYAGGYLISSTEFHRPAGALVQSLEIAEAVAGAAAQVLRNNGVPAFVESRMD
jgi:hypothetical protein